MVTSNFSAFERIAREKGKGQGGARSRLTEASDKFKEINPEGIKAEFDHQNIQYEFVPKFILDTLRNIHFRCCCDRSNSSLMHFWIYFFDYESFVHHYLISGPFFMKSRITWHHWIDVNSNNECMEILPL